MHHRVRKVEEEGFVLVRIDEANGLLGIALGEGGLVGGVFDDLLTTKERHPVALLVAFFEIRPGEPAADYDVICKLVGRVDPHIVGVGDPVVVFKTLVGRQAGRQMAEVPFPDAGSSVARILEHIGNGDLVGMQTLAAVGEEDRVHAESLVMAAGQQRGPGARADSAADIEVVEDHSIRSHLVEMGCLRSLGAVEADISIAHVVNEDDDDVRLLWRSGHGRG